MAAVCEAVNLERREAHRADEVSERFVDPVHGVEPCMAGVVKGDDEYKQDGTQGGRDQEQQRPVVVDGPDCS